jgi:ParB family chromosome partitioning protein
MKLDQLMAFSISDDHTRQEQVWEIIAQSHNREPYLIRRMLTEKTVRASDRRVRFVGLDAYLAAGGPSCVTCSRQTMAAGCRIRPCSTGW